MSCRISFWIFSFLIIIKSTALPAILYGLEFTQTLKISKVKCNSINNSIAMVCKIALRVGKKTSNLKVLMEAGIKPGQTVVRLDECGNGMGLMTAEM